MELIAKEWNRGYQIALFKNWFEYVAVFDDIGECEAFAEKNGHTIDWRKYCEEIGVVNIEAVKFTSELFEYTETRTECVGVGECSKWLAKAFKVAKGVSDEFHEELHELVDPRMKEATEHPNFDYSEVLAVVFWEFEDRGYFSP